MSRFHYLDALRGGAMLVVVAWHLTLLWPLAVTLSDSTNEGLEWALPLTRWSLPLFFLMAGFFGAALSARWGAWGYMRERLLRVGVPLAVGLATIVPLSKWILKETMPGIEVLGPLRGAMHLWFLWYLLIFIAVWAALAGRPAVQSLGRAAAERVGALFAPVLLALVGAILIAAGRQLPWPSEPWLVPQPENVAYFGLFFAVGALVYVGRQDMEPVGRRPWLYAAIALGALVPAVLLRVGPTGVGPFLLGDSLEEHAFLVAFCLIGWCATFAAVGFGRRWLSGGRPAIRYVADASYWIYLAHMPLLPLVILLVEPLMLPFPVAWTLSFGLVLGTLLATYELAIRHTVVGWVLNGPRPPRKWRLRRLLRRPQEAV